MLGLQYKFGETVLTQLAEATQVGAVGSGNIGVKKWTRHLPRRALSKYLR